MPDDEAQERAIVGALRAAIHDHGPITPERVGSAAKRILGNLRNARASRPAGAAAGAIACPSCGAEVDQPLRCKRCRHRWRAVTPPRACPSCKSVYWNVARGTVPRGRPKKVRPEEEQP